ncbi:hypothetical protein PVIIG_05792 [Plasmodium vivax India VII]|uniref:Uncharacterized protein n=1 Tax=Plasmodium vivax India VII TaxID=1077284 RepID=A0A0J9SIP1_PLAVI|nr:hypothetical protein PVIIG_05792 [Plasmodium vivax India VII]
MNDFLGNEKLGILRTKYFYDKFDNGWNICEGNTLYNTSKAELNQRTELHDVSEKILKALCYVYETSMREGFDNDSCKFLYYWLANILLKKLKVKDFYSEIIINLFANLNKGRDNNICTIPPFTTFNIDDFNKVKLIFDFSEDYNTYKTHFSQPNRLCNKDYYDYLDKYITSYKTIRSECTTERRDNIYCEAFHYYFDSKDHGLLSTWICNLSENLSPPEDRFKEVDGETPGLPQLRARPVIEEHDAQSRLSAYVRPHDSGLRFPPVPGLYTNTLELGSASAPTDNPSPSIASKSITGAVSVAGILVPSYLMYNVISIMIIKLNVIFYI